MTDRFGDIVDVLQTVAVPVATTIGEWAEEYLRALERQSGITPGTTKRLERPQVRHAGVWRHEEPTPACVVWPAGEDDWARSPDRDWRATVELGIAIIVSAPRPDDLATLLHRHVAVVRKLLWDRPTAGGAVHRLTLTDVDYTAIDVEARGRTLAQATFRYVAEGVPLGQAGAAPGPGDTPREDPLSPWPPVPTVLSTGVVLDPVAPQAPLEN